MATIRSQADSCGLAHDPAGRDPAGGPVPPCPGRLVGSGPQEALGGIVTLLRLLRREPAAVDQERLAADAVAAAEGYDLPGHMVLVDGAVQDIEVREVGDVVRAQVGGGAGALRRAGGDAAAARLDLRVGVQRVMNDGPRPTAVQLPREEKSAGESALLDPAPIGQAEDEERLYTRAQSNHLSRTRS